MKRIILGLAVLSLMIPMAQAAKKGPACESIKNRTACEVQNGCVWGTPGQSSKQKCMKAKATPRTGVLIPAAPRPVPPQAASIPLYAVPPLLVLYDLNRRLNCLNPPDPAGLGGPGFDGKPVDPAKGNVMIPCWQRRLMAGGTPTPTR